jgi:G3E family GTPase
VDPNIIFGLDSKLFLDKNDVPASSNHHDEVETVTILRGEQLHSHSCSNGVVCSHHHDAGSTASAHASDSTSVTILTPEDLDKALNALSKDTIWRVKGFVRISSGQHILNWAFGRYNLTVFDGEGDREVKLTMMGERGEVKRAARAFAQAIGAVVV